MPTDHPELSISPSELERLSIFPLPGAVLFPHSLLPLHIFEPRYRAMTQHLLERDLPLGVAVLQPGYEDHYHQHPAIFDTLGVGRIIHHEALPDGRFNLVLRGVCRAHLLREHRPLHPWREVAASLIPEQHTDPERVHSLLDTLRGCLFGLGHQHARLANLIIRRLNAIHDPSALADSLLSALLPDPNSRLEALADPNVASRLERLNACVADLLLHHDLPTGELN